MRLPPAFYQIEQTLSLYLSELRPAQQTGLALWVYGTLLAQSACQNAVLTALWGVANFHSLRQCLREWLYDGPDKAAPCHVQVSVQQACTGLVRWLVALWSDTRLFLALDATGHRDCLTVLTISVLYRGAAIPLWWSVLPGNQPGAWNPVWLGMLSALQPLLPKHWQVLVLCDRGLWSPDLYRAIGAAGWHPLMRVRHNLSFAPQGRCRVPARLLVGGGQQAWVGRGRAFKAKPLPTTLIAVWPLRYPEPCLVLTDLAPDQVGIVWYGLRMWIEAGFRLLKSGGWQWHKTRRTDCERAARHFLVLAIATLWTLAYGTQVQEQAGQALPWTIRIIEGSGQVQSVLGVFALGLKHLQRHLYQGRLRQRLKLKPQPLPQPPEQWNIVYHCPSDTG